MDENEIRTVIVTRGNGSGSRYDGLEEAVADYLKLTVEQVAGWFLIAQAVEEKIAAQGERDAHGDRPNS